MLASAFAAVAASLSEILGGAASSEAAVLWGHPFDHPRTISYGYGMREGGMHRGLDYPATSGQPAPMVRAIADGVVFRKVTNDGGYGNYVEVKHSNGWSSLYGHLANPSGVSGLLVRGQAIGTMGNTGNSYGVHLHIEIRTSPGDFLSAIDPYPYIQDAPLAGSNPPEIDMTPQESAALFDIQNKLTEIRNALMNGRPEYYGGQYSAFDVLLSHATQAKDIANQIKPLAEETKDRVRGSDPTKDMLQAILAKVNTLS